VFKIFLSYSHSDLALKEALVEHLSPLERSRGLLIVWSDDQMTAGTMFDATIRAEMCESKIVLLLLSASYFKSPYCWQIERPLALELQKAGKAKVVGVLMRSCAWENTEIDNGTLLIPRGRRAVTSWPDRDEALTEIAKEIDRVIDELTPPDLSTGGMTGPAVTHDPETFYCVPVYDPPVAIRARGITELLPDLVLRFHGDPGLRRIVDVRLTVNTNITSRMGPHGMTEATLSLATGRCITSVPNLGRSFRGRQISQNTLGFLHVPLHELRLLDPADRNLRISNVRVNAAQLGISSTQSPAHVVVYVSVTDTVVESPQFHIAKILPQFDFRLSPIADQTALPNLRHGEGLNSALSGSNSDSSRSFRILTFSGRLAEHEPLGEGTRLLVRFSFVPRSMALFVTTQQLSAVPSGLTATLTQANIVGMGPFLAEEGREFVEWNERSHALHRLDSSNTTAYAVWEVEGTSANSAQAINLGLRVVCENESGPGRPPLETLVSGHLAPLSMAGVADQSSPIPRFASSSPDLVLFSRIPE
jgi:TIR domain